MAIQTTSCLSCGQPLGGLAPNGLCSRCLLVTGLDPTQGATLASDAVPGDIPVPLPSGFGDYELQEEIARGGMGVVYRARQVSLDRIVAVKMILGGQFASRQVAQRFKGEAVAAAVLHHPNIVAVHDVGVQDGQHFFSMDFVQGQNLAQLVGNQPLPAQKAARYLKLIAEAIHYAHQQGILHRDLKPSNVLVDSATDQPRITDFGLAKRLDGNSSLTLTGQVLGSPNFMPPEQAGAQHGKVGRHSDVYGLGGILYHSLTARPPFQAESLEGIVTQVLHSEPVSPRLLNPSVPRDLETICLKCLEKDPKKRFANAQDVADELGRFLRDEPIQARPVTRAERVWRWCRRKPALASAVGLAAALLLVVSIGSPLVALRLDRARQQTALNLYAADIKGANVALSEDDLLGARKLLNQIANSPDQRDLRGWEWRYLMDQCRSDELATLGTHDRWVEGVAFSPDDKILASISGDGVVKLWDWRLRTKSLSWQAHEPVMKHQDMMPKHAIMFLPRTSILATTGADELAHFWNLGSTNLLATFPSPGGPSGLLACTPDGRLLATGSKWDQILLWDVSDIHHPKQVAMLPTGMRYIWAVLFLADGKSLLASSGPEKVQWWDISNLERPKRKKDLPGELGMALTHDGRRLVSGFTVWEVDSLESKEGRPLAESQRYHATSSLFNFSPDGRSLASRGGLGNIMIWDMNEKCPPVTLKGHEDAVRSVSFTSDGRILASGSLDATIRLWDAADIWRDDSDKQPVLRHGFRVVALAFSPDSNYLASISWEDPQQEKSLSLAAGTLKLWNAPKRTEIATVPIHNRVGFAVVGFSPDSQNLVIEDKRQLHLYNVPSLQLVTNWPGSRPAYSNDGLFIVYAITNRIVRRTLATGQEALIGEHTGNGVDTLVLSPDGRIAVTSGRGGVLTFWDTAGRDPPVTVENHTRDVERLAFSPDGQVLASAGHDGKLGLWTVKGRRNLDLLRGHKEHLSEVAFSPDGRTVATLGDQTLRLWNLKTRREVAVLRGHAEEALAFSPDGQWIASGGGDTIRFWHAPTFEELIRAESEERTRK